MMRSQNLSGAEIKIFTIKLHEMSPKTKVSYKKKIFYFCA
jgi:hypothetical protein